MASDLEGAMQVLRSQRHHFLNHLQVIDGWIQLGREQRAAAYIRQVGQRLEAEGRVLQAIDNPAVALFVVQTNLLAESHGVAVEWQVEGPVDCAALPELDSRLTAALERLSHLPAEQRWLRVRLGSQIGLHTPLSPEEG